MRSVHWKVIAIAVIVSILTQKQYGYGPMIVALIACSFIAWMQRSKMRRMGGKEAGCEQSAEFQTSQEPEQVIGKVKDYFQKIKAKMVMEDPTIVLLIVTTPWSASTFGERVFVAVEKDETGGTSVYVKSTPRFSLALYDWGKNIAHINEIKKAIG